MKRLILSTLLLGIFHATFSQDEAKPMKIAENLYVASGLWCNATFFVADDQVYVFDAGNDFSQGESLMAQIKQVTDKKVKTLVYTHFHDDHVGGACALPENIEIIAHENLTSNLKMFEKLFIDKRDNQLPEAIKKLENELAKSSEPDTIKEKKKKELENMKNELAGLKKMTFRFPTKTIKDSLIIKTSNEVIKILFMNLAHTSDNVVVEFEKANVVCLGDILFSNCYPYIGWKEGVGLDNWKKILTNYANKGFKNYIPGHGNLASSDDLLSLAAYLSDMENAVASEAKTGKSIEEIQKSMPKLEKYKHYGFEFMWPQNIEAFFNLAKK